MHDEADPADAFIAESADLPTLDREGRRELLRQARDGDTNARREYVYALSHQTAVCALSARPAWLQRIEAIQEGIIVLLTLLDDPFVEDPERVLTERVIDDLQSLPRPRGSL